MFRHKLLSVAAYLCQIVYASTIKRLNDFYFNVKLFQKFILYITPSRKFNYMYQAMERLKKTNQLNANTLQDRFLHPDCYITNIYLRALIHHMGGASVAEWTLATFHGHLSRSIDFHVWTFFYFMWIDSSTQVPARAWNNVRRGTWGLPPTVKLESRHITFTVSVRPKTQQKNIIYTQYLLHNDFIIDLIKYSLNILLISAIVSKHIFTVKKKY